MVEKRTPQPKQQKQIIEMYNNNNNSGRTGRMASPSPNSMVLSKKKLYMDDKISLSGSVNGGNGSYRENNGNHNGNNGNTLRRKKKSSRNGRTNNADKRPKLYRMIQFRDDFGDEPATPSSLVSSDVSTVDMKDRIGSGQSNILVAVRVRPLLRREADAGVKNIVRVLQKRIVVVLDPGVDSDDVLRLNRSREKRYAFDHVFDASSNQMEVFQQSVSFLLEGVLNGYNATVFAYGATGSGKTFTMLGSETSPGLMPLTLDALFRAAEENESKEYIITLSYIEIYNETIRDLLNPSDSDVLDLREDSKGVKVVGVTEYHAKSAQEVMILLKRGNKNRTQEPTNMNEESSRSHAVLQVVIEQRDRSRDMSEVVNVSKLSLIDLAGSERAAVSQNRGIRLLEGANINRSLLALGNCINALGDRRNKGSYVPYRDSKLTRLLKDSLGGNCRTVMIATIAPSHLTIEDSVNTLKYANRAKNIKTTVSRNELNVDHHIVEYERIVTSMRNEIRELKERLQRGDGTTIHHSRTIQFDQLRESLKRNFEERLLLRQSILDIEAQDRESRFLCERLNNELSLIAAYDSIDGKEAMRLRREIATMTQNIMKNTKELNERQEHLQTLESNAALLRKEIQSMATSAELKVILELMYRNELLELENLRITAKSNLSNYLLKNKDMYIQKLEQQIHVRDRIIQQDRMLLSNQGVPFTELNVAPSTKGYITTRSLLEKKETYFHLTSSHDEMGVNRYDPAPRPKTVKDREKEREDTPSRNMHKEPATPINVGVSIDSMAITRQNEVLSPTSNPANKPHSVQSASPELPRLNSFPLSKLTPKPSFNSLDLLRRNNSKKIQLPIIHASAGGATATTAPTNPVPTTTAATTAAALAPSQIRIALVNKDSSPLRTESKSSLGFSVTPMVFSKRNHR